MSFGFGAAELARELDELLLRIEQGGADAETLSRALASLRTSTEELRVLHEELEQRTDELANAYAQAESERLRYEDLFALSPDAYIVSDLAGKIIEANEVAQELLLVEGRFLEGKPLATFVSPKQRRAFRTLTTSAAAANRTDGEFRFARRAGIAFDAQVSVQPILDGRNRVPSGLRWVIRDVTEQKQNEERLWELNAELEKRVEKRTAALEQANARLTEERVQFSTVLQELPAAVIVVDPSGDVLVRNDRADALLGQPVRRIEQLLSVAVDEDGRSLAADDSPLRRVLTDGSPVQGLSVELVRDGGDHAILEASAAPVGSADRRERVVYVLHDASERLLRERAQRDFVVNAAHELRTPLTAVVSSVEILRAGAKEIPADRDRFLDHLAREADRLVRLTRALLTLSRAQSGEEEARRELVPLRPMLESIAESLRPAPGVTVAVECDADIAVLANSDLLVQALTNLAGNATQHTRAGAIVLRARVLDDGRAVAEVVDTGPGLPAGEELRVLQRFYRGGRRDAEGFGLGLSIAAEAARAAGGEIQLESEEGVGTTGRIVLPLARLVAA